MRIQFPIYSLIRERLDQPDPKLSREEASIREMASRAIHELEKANEKIFDTATDMIVEFIEEADKEFAEYDTFLMSIRDKLASGDFSPIGLSVEIDMFINSVSDAAEKEQHN